MVTSGVPETIVETKMKLIITGCRGEIGTWNIARKVRAGADLRG